MTQPVLVIRCDLCGTVTPGRFGRGLHTPPMPETERLAELKREGWTLTPSRDLCPRCVRARP